ncbi:MAG: hypothetical protein SGBAC_001006 [Bacillariaceae sp.]
MSHQLPPEFKPLAGIGPTITIGGPFAAEELTRNLNNDQLWFETHGNYRSAEWIVDCYRMRADDDVVWGSENFHGLYEIGMAASHRASYSSHSKAFIVVKDFLKFLKLGIRNEVIPPSNFNFALCIGYFAPNLLVHAFEKQDAKMKWGGENVFSTGPSLRRTAETIYALSAMSPYDDAEAQEKGKRIQREVSELLELQLDASNFDASEDLIFEDVGGKQLWTGLFHSLFRHYEVHG